mgnify:CR=1 FL=1
MEKRKVILNPGGSKSKQSVILFQSLKIVYKLEDEKPNTHNLDSAIKKAHEWNAKIPLGVFYEANQATYEDDEPGLKNGPLVEQPLDNASNIAREIMTEFI